MQLKAIVIGSGWAGEGHTLALRSAGVDVVALCGRSPTPTASLAERLNIPETRLDWRNAISEFRPDIVAIATPVPPHRDIAEAAAAAGCHIFCDKPLAVSAADARAMLAAVRRAGVKHAYGPASCLGAAITHARHLVDDGLIGTLTSVESRDHAGLTRPVPYSWFHLTGQGGGMLFNLFTHKLAQVLCLTGGVPTHVTGEAHCFVTKAPVGPQIHDFRELFSPTAEVDETDPTLWRPADADTLYLVALRLSLPGGGEVTARFDGSLLTQSRFAPSLSVYGTKGSLELAGVNGNSPDAVHHYDNLRGSWEQLTVPAVADIDSSIEDAVQRDWNTLFRRFVAEIRGEEQAFYPTFEDGWRAAEIIDIIRDRQPLVPVPASPGGW